MDQKNINDAAQRLADNAVGEILKAASDPGKIGRILRELKRQIAGEAAILAGEDYHKFVYEPDVLLWDLAKAAPDFNINAFSQSRLSWISLAAAVTLGWVLGGVLSTLLGFLGLGGEIIRAASIFALVWVEDYLASSPQARHRFLKYAGWLTLAGFAARLGSGLFRLGGGLKSLVFGAARPGFFKSIWLIIGAAIVFVFFSKRSSGVDPVLIKSELKQQVEERLTFMLLILEKISQLSKTVAECQKNADSEDAYCPRNECVLANGMMAIMDNLPPEQRQYVRDRLILAGYKPDEGNSFGRELIWNKEEHSPLYDTLGFVKDGDRCLVLKRPIIKEGNVRRGLVQALSAGSK